MPGTLLSDRIVGCLLGGALGDAIGARFEGEESSCIFEIPSALRVTDDTQLTIATCEAIIAAGEVDPESIAARFLTWFRARRIRGIGASTLKALNGLSAGGHWAYVGATGEYSAGNGAAMRIAPVAFLLAPNDHLQRRIMRDVACITHRNDEAWIGALAIACTIRFVAAGQPPDRSLLPVLIGSLPDSRVRDRLIAVHSSVFTIGQYSSRFASTGYVVDSVPLAILAAISSSDLLDTIAQIVQCGGDTDTVASMFGQIYGAAYGTHTLPMDLIERIDLIALLWETATAFSQLSDAM